MRNFKRYICKIFGHSKAEEVYVNNQDIKYYASCPSIDATWGINIPEPTLMPKAKLTRVRKRKFICQRCKASKLFLVGYYNGKIYSEEGEG